MQTATTDSDLILDFFAGSGTIAHAVMAQNIIDGENRRFAIVQLPEPLDIENDDQKVSAEYCDKLGKPRNIAELTKERVRRVIQKYNESEASLLPINGKRERGFRVYKLANSNFKSWDAQTPKDAKVLDKQLELHIEHIREGRTSDDILYELLLKSGFPLTAPVERLKLAGKQVYGVAGGAMLICLEKELTLEVLRAMAEKKPERVVCLDAGFAGNDQLKTNAVQIFKSAGVTSFKTV